jgi:FtsZ-interacting cell division protein ZipA
MKKKAQFEMEQVVRVIIILALIALVVVGIYVLRDKLAYLYEQIKTFLRFR